MPNYVPRLEKILPGFGRRLGSGELHHSLVDHLTNRLTLVLPIEDATRVMNRYDATGEGARDAIARRACVLRKVTDGRPT